jgi:GntR family transcriptional regulator
LTGESETKIAIWQRFAVATSVFKTFAMVGVMIEFQIDPASNEPIYRQLVSQVLEAIAQAELLPGDRLPSLRDLSRELVINPNTVARAYTELERNGILVSRPGLGVFVGSIKPVMRKNVGKAKLIASVDQLLTEAVHLGFDWNEVRKLISERSRKFHWTDNRATSTNDP